jgi:hypothetical protein
MSMRRDLAVDKNVPCNSRTFVKPTAGSATPPPVLKSGGDVPTAVRRDGEKSRNSTGVED